jgi:hypothetical protein
MVTPCDCSCAYCKEKNNDCWIQQSPNLINNQYDQLYNLTKGMMPFNSENANFGYLQRYIFLKQ